MTLQQFEKIPDDEIFATGILPNTEEGLNMFGWKRGQMLRWIAKKGIANDWTIFCHLATNTVEWIEKNGDKVNLVYNIKRCISCDDEMLKLYSL